MVHWEHTASLEEQRKPMATETKAETKETKKDNKKPKVKEAGQGNIVTNTLTTIRTYFTDVRSELNKVSWPDRADVIRLTRIVLIVTILASLALGAISIGFSELIRFGLTQGTYNWLIFAVIFVAVILITLDLFRQPENRALTALMRSFRKKSGSVREQ
jgi:preprotein translocase SecE subunit